MSQRGKILTGAFIVSALILGAIIAIASSGDDNNSIETINTTSTSLSPTTIVTLPSVLSTLPPTTGPPVEVPSTITPGTTLLVPGSTTTLPPTTSPPEQPQGSITVAVDASLTGAFTKIGAKFEHAHQGTDVTFSFDTSTALVQQIQGGAPTDVFASADEASMGTLVSDGSITATPTVFAHDKLEIAVAPGNPQHVQHLADLADVGAVALCDPSVACGQLADAVLAAAGVVIPEERITRVADASAALSAVSSGSADATIVFISDVKAAGTSVHGVKIPDAQNQFAIYPIAPLANAGNPAVAQEFIDAVLSPAGHKILKHYGFSAP